MCEKEPVQLLRVEQSRTQSVGGVKGKTDRKRTPPPRGAILTSCLVSLEDSELHLVQNWPPIGSGLTSRSQHCSQPPDASTILKHLLPKALYIQSKGGVCTYTRMHTRVTARAKPKNRVNASLREGSLHVMP